MTRIVQGAHSPLAQELQVFLKEERLLSHKIRNIDNRLKFGYSEPLNDYKMQLIKQQLQLNCSLTSLLMQF